VDVGDDQRNRPQLAQQFEAFESRPRFDAGQSLAFDRAGQGPANLGIVIDDQTTCSLSNANLLARTREQASPGLRKDLSLAACRKMLSGIKFDGAAQCLSSSRGQL
jgi:hypothetical protein